MATDNKRLANNDGPYIGSVEVIKEAIKSFNELLPELDRGDLVWRLKTREMLETEARTILREVQHLQIRENFGK